MQHRSLSAWLALTLLAVTVASVPGADPAPELRYRWKAGQTLVYKVTIEVDHGDYTETLSGTPVYQINAADQDGIKLTFRGSLSERTQLKPDKKGILLPRGRPGFSPFGGVGTMRTIELTINERGEVVALKGATQLPYLLGNLS
jgi:hypothetical protein